MNDSFRYYPLEPSLQITHLISLFHEKYPSNFRFDGETHDFWEFVYIDRGQLLITTGKNQYLLKTGEIVFHKPQEFHALQAYNNKSADVITSAFVCDSPLMNHFEHRIMPLTTREREYLYSAVRMRHEFFKTAIPSVATIACEQIIRNNLELFLLHLINRGQKKAFLSHETRMESYTQQKKLQKLAKAINTYMEEHLSEKLSLEKIASDLNYSVSHMTKLYHQQTGQSIISSFTKLKMTEALRRIQEGDKTITQIAADLGYDNIAYFSRVFTKHHGITATEAAHSYKSTTEDTNVIGSEHNEALPQE